MNECLYVTFSNKLITHQVSIKEILKRDGGLETSFSIFNNHFKKLYKTLRKASKQLEVGSRFF